MEQLVSFEVAKLARELSFKELCWLYYDNGGNINHSITKISNNMSIIAAPTQAVLARWLREKMDLYIEMKHYITSNSDGTSNVLYQSEIIYPRLFHIQSIMPINNWEVVLENALLEALKYLKMCKERGKLEK